MLSHNHFTIIIVTFDSVARVDLLAGKSVSTLQESCVNRSAQAELGSSVKVGLNLGAKKCGKVFVLSDEFWSGHVSLTDEVVGALSADQIEQALALEAEHESGISPFESRLGYCLIGPIDGKTTYWTTQVEATQLDAIEKELPSWVRKVYGFAAIDGPTSSTDNADSGSEITLPESNEQIAVAWLTKYLSAKSELAIIESLTPTWTEKQTKQVSTLVAIGVLVLCGILHVVGNGRLSNHNDELAQLDQQAEQLRRSLIDGEKSIQHFRDIQLRQVASQRAHSERIEELRALQLELANDRKRPVAILEALASTAAASHWIQSVVMNRTEVLIVGIGVDSNAVTGFAERLERELDASSWRVQPAVMSIEESTQLVRFELKVIPIDASASQVASYGRMENVR